MIRNFLFSIFFYIGIIFICLIYLPSLVLPYKVTLTGGRLMGCWAKFCLTFFLSTKIVVKGRENILDNEKFFIACSHQSMFETFYLQIIFNSPVFILKKELLNIPIFGWYLKKLGCISIDRNKISKYLKNIPLESKNFNELDSNTPPKKNALLKALDTINNPSLFSIKRS